ncbi:hypothetical protein Bca4012_023937 [Brassica carinata]
MAEAHCLVLEFCFFFFSFLYLQSKSESGLHLSWILILHSEEKKQSNQQVKL